MDSKPLLHIPIDPSNRRTLLRHAPEPAETEKPPRLPVKETRAHPSGTRGSEDGSIYFIGTATTVIEWAGVRILTDPNFLHAGDHVHLGPGVTAQRRTNPAVDLEQLPGLDCILLSHFHEDHFDKKVERALGRDVPILTTPHAQKCLTDAGIEGGPFQAVTALDHFESAMLEVTGPDAQRRPVFKVTGTPGKHVAPGPLAVANDLLGAVPPTNGWLLELGHSKDGEPQPRDVNTDFRVYISGDTLYIDDLVKDTLQWLQGQQIDLMLVHLGGTTIPGSKAPLVMVTMDAMQGVKMMKAMDPTVTVPIHYDDYDVFLSPLEDFKKEVQEAGLQDKVVYLDRGDQYRFSMRNYN
ncbi:hypothetical protein INS49_010696 [Diaporthe citri]|uniref:uncharacterized protein n=1 Tax=Diaporthe citri TaxID=83186 RepID=UPI001C800C24|nr:uncharacterized protein INS49_010696 [Diaporthe citri]KAG6362466.1 hypothetical protein INS49_010696 [Diaporthe citri]